jgi:hypothetical protein
MVPAKMLENHAGTGPCRFKFKGLRHAPDGMRRVIHYGNGFSNNPLVICFVRKEHNGFNKS